MGRRTPKASAGEELTHKLLQSVRETKAGQAARVTKIELNEVAQARQKFGTIPDAVCRSPWNFQTHAPKMGARPSLTVRSGADADSNCQAPSRSGQGGSRVSERRNKSIDTDVLSASFAGLLFAGQLRRPAAGFAMRFTTLDRYAI